MRFALPTPARTTLVAALLLAATACGGGSDSSGAEAPEAAPTTQAPEYKLSDRDTFLAGDPDCDELTAWYTQFPADTDADTAVALVSACGTLPQAFVKDPDRISVSETLLEALLSDGPVKVAPAARTVAHQLLSGYACDTFDDNAKSLWQVESEIIDAGGSARDYPPVIALAKKRCPEHRDDLGMFDTKDPVGAATKLRKYIEGNFTVPPAEDSEYAAMAGVTCQYLRRGDSLSNASTLFEYLPLESGNGSTIGRKAAELFCSSRL